MTALSSTEISVSWNHPTVIFNSRVLVTLYQVLYQPLETFGGAIGPLTMNVTSTSVNLMDLQESVQYAVSVQVHASTLECLWGCHICMGHNNGLFCDYNYYGVIELCNELPCNYSDVISVSTMQDGEHALSVSYSSYS